jgi:hypothetical protein
MSDALRKALGGLRGDALRAQRKGGDQELQIRIGLAESDDDENNNRATYEAHDAELHGDGVDDDVNVAIAREERRQQRMRGNR